MLNLTDFINKYNGKKIDFDGVYGAQCVDVIKYWFQNLGLPTPHGNGNQYAQNASASVPFVKNTPTGVPKPGDVIVFNSKIGSQYGHVSIFVEGDVNSFRSFDQNFPEGSACAIRSHNYNAVDGWLHPTVLDTPPAPPPPPPPVADPRDTEIVRLNDLLSKANVAIEGLTNQLKEKNTALDEFDRKLHEAQQNLYSEEMVSSGLESELVACRQQLSSPTPVREPEKSNKFIELIGSRRLWMVLLGFTALYLGTIGLLPAELANTMAGFFGVTTLIGTADKITK